MAATSDSSCYTFQSGISSAIPSDLQVIHPNLMLPPPSKPPDRVSRPPPPRSSKPPDQVSRALSPPPPPKQPDQSLVTLVSPLFTPAKPLEFNTLTKNNGLKPQPEPPDAVPSPSSTLYAPSEPPEPPEPPDSGRSTTTLSEPEPPDDREQTTTRPPPPLPEPPEKVSLSPRLLSLKPPDQYSLSILQLACKVQFEHFISCVLHSEQRAFPPLDSHLIYKNISHPLPQKHNLSEIFETYATTPYCAHHDHSTSNFNHKAVLFASVIFHDSCSSNHLEVEPDYRVTATVIVDPSENHIITSILALPLV